jgi:hypothetical protein
MKALRISASILGIAAFAALAACGGGGGGPVSPPGGGGGPTPGHSSSPSPTASPTPTPTPTTGPTATPTPTSSPGIGVSSTIETAYDGSTAPLINGTDNWQTNGTTMNGDPGDGDTASGAQGTANVDGIPCGLNSESQMTSSNYHVHAFVGIMVNGTQYAIPDGIGIIGNPSGEPITSWSDCAYYIHTHGASGVIHVEDPTINGTYQNTQPPPQYNLQALFDIWGQGMNSLGAGGFSGPPTVYTGTPSGTYNGGDLVNSYSLTTASAASVLLQHHVVIWLVYGTPPSQGLPQVNWQIEN